MKISMRYIIQGKTILIIISNVICSGKNILSYTPRLGVHTGPRRGLRQHPAAETLRALLMQIYAI